MLFAVHHRARFPGGRAPVGSGTAVEAVAGTAFEDIVMLAAEQRVDPRAPIVTTDRIEEIVAVTAI